MRLARRAAATALAEHENFKAAGVAASLAACAGATDVLALTGLGGAFASIITGNLVIAGRSLAVGRPGDAVSGAVAVAGFGAGVALWALWLRFRPGSLLVLLLAELVVLAGVTAGWMASDALPNPVLARALLGLASLAMGGQSVVATSLRTATTYLTGTLAGAVIGLTTGRRAGLLPALRQLGALIAGAAGAAAVFRASRSLLPMVALACLVLALALYRPREGG
jgi:uncharacterized membrane protein YoaK (UPF0700 family)